MGILSYRNRNKARGAPDVNQEQPPKPVGPLVKEPDEMQSEPAVTHPTESPCSPPKTTVSVSLTHETSQPRSTGLSPLSAPAKVMSPTSCPCRARKLPARFGDYVL
jgi:hypothetical protein